MVATPVMLVLHTAYTMVDTRSVANRILGAIVSIIIIIIINLIIMSLDHCIHIH